MPKVSAIIPVYNTEKYLRKCLESVCNQTLSDIEIICINDGSSDGSSEILREFALLDNRVKIIDFKENKGVATARNAGMEVACGEYIGFVDSDDWMDLDFYEKLYNAAIKSGADVTKSNLIFENFTNVAEKYHNLREVKKNKLNLNHIPTTIIKKQFLRDNNILFPENLKNSEDCVFEVKVGLYTNKIKIVKGVFYHYNFNNRSLNNSAKYSFAKIKNIIASLSMIVDVLNESNVDKKTYQQMISYRYNSLTILFFYRCNEVYANIDEFSDLIVALKTKIKYEFNDVNERNADLVKKIEDVSLPNEKGCGEIPKRIFYVWLGGKKPPLVNICIENWREKLKDFEIIEINEQSPYFDFDRAYNTCKWFKAVYDRKLWAYVADYIRCKVLYDYGGVYFDTDVTVCKDITPLLKNNVFVGREKPHMVSAAVFGAVKQHPLFAGMLDFYENQIFQSPLYVITHIITEELVNKKYDDVAIYREDYFYPFYGDEEFSHSCVTPNTYTIHWWNNSWLGEEQEFFLDNKHRMRLEDIDKAFRKYKYIKFLTSLMRRAKRRVAKICRKFQ